MFTFILDLLYFGEKKQKATGLFFICNQQQKNFYIVELFNFGLNLFEGYFRNLHLNYKCN